MCAVVAWPRLVVVLVLIVTAALGSQLRHLRLEVNLHDEIPQQHPYMQIDQLLKERFNVHQTALVAVGVRDGDVFTETTLLKLKRLTRDVAHIPGVVPSSVMSLASSRAKAIYPETDGVRIAPLLETIPSGVASGRALRATVFSYPMYIGSLVSADGRGALLMADFADDADSEEVTGALESLATRERDENTDIYVGGEPAALAALQKTTRSMLPLLLLAVVVIALVHYEAFRTMQAVLLPLATAGLSVIWAMGLMALLGFDLTPWTAVTAILVL